MESVSSPQSRTGEQQRDSSPVSNEELLDRFQFAAFRYFLEQVNPANGLVADTTRGGAPCSIAVVGFALSCYPIGVTRGWMTRAEAIALTLAALRFFHASPQNETPLATGYRGFYYHFLDMRSGERVWRSELSVIDTALLLAGVLVAQQYFTGSDSAESEIRDLAGKLYGRVDWQWSQNQIYTVTQGWKPECGFLHYGWEGYSEALILYALGLGSPAHPLPADSYDLWTSTYQWENLYGYSHLYAGPLFIHQFAHAWIDFRRLQDGFMREKRCDYFENTRRATHVQREYAIRNPHEFQHYGRDFWGLTACDGPGSGVVTVHGVRHRLFGYVARGVPFGPDDGTISPAAIFGSLPFAPEIAFSAIRHLCEVYPRMSEEYTIPNAVNPTVNAEQELGWVSHGHFGLDQGLIVLMIENYRTEWLWNLMHGCPYIETGLRRAGFAGGWLGKERRAR